jgi:hypothetical protein
MTLMSSQASLFFIGEAAPKSKFFVRQSEENMMNASTPITQKATNQAGFPPAPSEAHQKANFKKDTVDFQALLTQALTQPGQLSTAYKAFHNFSILNQALAFKQCLERGLQVSPLASFNAWKEKGRMVQKGQKEISLFMPLTKKIEAENEQGQTEEKSRTFFALKPHWFVLSQTEGNEVEFPALPAWNLSRALEALDVEKVDFEMMNGNCQGYATARKIAVNPVAAFPLKTAIHEMAHVLLGHTTEADCADSELTPRNIAEVEAEAVAYIVTSILGTPGQESSRAYIQGWLGSEPITDLSIRKIFACADKIMKAGQQGQ